MHCFDQLRKDYSKDLEDEEDKRREKAVKMRGCGEDDDGKKIAMLRRLLLDVRCFCEVG